MFTFNAVMNKNLISMLMILGILIIIGDESKMNIIVVEDLKCEKIFDEFLLRKLLRSVKG